MSFKPWSYQTNKNGLYAIGRTKTQIILLIHAFWLRSSPYVYCFVTFYKMYRRTTKTLSHLPGKPFSGVACHINNGINPLKSEWTLSHYILEESIFDFRYVRLYDVVIPEKKNDWTICKQWRPWSDAAFCGVWSGSALFASYSWPPVFNGLKVFHVETARQRLKSCFGKRIIYYTWFMDQPVRLRNLIGVFVVKPGNIKFFYEDCTVNRESSDRTAQTIPV